MEKSLKDHLIDAFDDLGQDNLKRFKDKLCDRREEPRVRRAQIEKLTHTWDLATLMVETFTSRDAPAVTIEILEAIRCNEQAVNLREATGHSTHFIDRHRKKLIQRVNNVDAILDELLQEDVISHQDYDEIRSKNTSSQKMRDLLSGPLKSAGTAGKDALYEALKKLQVYLIKELEGQ